MNLNVKLFLPAFILLATIAATVHFYWLPNYLKLEIESQLKNEQTFVELLGTTLVPDLLNNDLAKTHATLNSVMKKREYWHDLKLYDKEGLMIYPLIRQAPPKDTELENLEHSIIFNGETLSRILVELDINASTSQRVAQVHHLEHLLLFTLLVAALISALLQNRWIRAPLQQLAMIASDIAQGKYDSELDYQSRDEVGKLADAFNSMRKQIRQRESELVESQERNKALIDNALDGIISIDARGIVLSLNPAAEHIFGYMRNEVIGNNIKMLMPEPYRNEHDGYLHNYTSTGKKKIIGIGREVEGLRKDGTTFPLDLAVSEVKLGDRQLFIGIIRDITERKFVELQTSHYANALEQLHTITTDSEADYITKFQYVLDLGRQLFSMPLAIISHVNGEQYTVEHVSSLDGAPPPGTEFKLGETYCCHTLTANAATGFEHAAESEIHNHPCYTAFGLESYIGAPIYVNGKLYGTLNFSSPETHNPPFNNGDYNLIKLFAQWIGSEITRLQAESELYNTTALRQAIMDSANFSIISTDTNGVIKIFNKGAERMLGYSAEELIDIKTPAILHDLGEVVDRAAELSDQLGHTIEPGFEVFVCQARAGIPDEREWTYIRKDGTRLPVMLSVTAVHSANGDIIGFLGIGSDLTERKKIDQMKSEFISTVSHELRTPLTSIRGALGLVLGKGGADLPPKLLRMLETANRNSERLTFLINDILDLEKINGGKLDFQLDAINLHAIAQRATDENEGYAHSHKVNLNLHFDTDISTMVRVDEQRMLQVFANLISNAVKYSPENGTVQINVQRIKDRVRVSVIDNGPGIPEEFRSRIFGRFAQADSSDTREKGGTGLGLTITKAIVEQLNGVIGFNSVPGEGAEFYFELPAWDQTIENTELDASLPKVLVCEDDPDVAYILVNLLEQEGLSGDIASTANSALELIHKNTYRLLLLDLNLPDTNGLELIRQLRSTEATRKLPVIVVSGRADEGRIEFNGDAVTVADWLQKPIDRERLALAVTDAIRDNNRPHILHVEDDLDIIQVSRALFEEESDFEYATSLSEARQKLDDNTYNLVIIDISLPDGSGLELLDQIGSDCPVVLFSGQETNLEISQNVAATLTKSRTSNDELIHTVKRLLIQTT
jgi:PAS domain S-box-containing protein